MRKPDNVIWSWPWVAFNFGLGFTRQTYNVDAKAVTICFGPLTLRWHKR